MKIVSISKHKSIVHSPLHNDCLLSILWYHWFIGTFVHTYALVKIAITDILKSVHICRSMYMNLISLYLIWCINITFSNTDIVEAGSFSIFFMNKSYYTPLEQCSNQLFYFVDVITFLDWELIGTNAEVVDISIYWYRDVHRHRKGILLNNVEKNCQLAHSSVYLFI